MQLWPTILLLLLLSSCASNKITSEITEGAANRPQWVNDPVEFCGDEKLCAVGEGISFLRAESEARKNLAKIFKVQVIGTTSVTQQTSSVSSADFLDSAGVSEEVEVRTREAVDEVLEGVVTSKKHQEGSDVFALAELDKITARKLVKPRIEKLDAEIEQAYESGRRSLLPRAFDLEAERSALQSFLAVLGIPDFSRGVTHAQLLERKAQFDADPRIVLVEDNGRWQAVAETVAGELTTLGYKVVNKGKHHLKINVENSARREYLNVKGFERYHMNVKLTATNTAGEVIGGMAFERTENGRSLSQIRANVLEDFREYFYDQLPGLQLD